MTDDVIKLIGITVVKDSIGNQVKQEIPKEVFCTIESITRAKFYQASQSGLKAQIKAVVCEFDYSGESLVEYASKRYSVYRTFTRNDERIELYLTMKAGIT